MSEETAIALLKVAGRIRRRADALTWEPPWAERANYWHMNGLKYELECEAEHIEEEVRAWLRKS